MGDNLMDLPPGFRFHPTDEEIITHYLRKKVVNKTFSSIAIGEADLNRCEPWNLPSKAKMGEKEWYFFCKRDKKYPTGTRTNRATESGYWKATGKDKEIFYRGKSSLVGMKKTLVFYLGRAPKGQKTNWVMHEYRLEGKLSGYDPPGTSNDEWVICRVFHKSKGPKTRPSPELERTDSFGALLSSADDRFTYNGDGMAVKASSTAMLNPSYLASTMPMEYPRDPQRSFFTNNNGELCSGFPSQEAILYPQGAVGLPGQLSPSSANAGYMHQDRNLGFPSQTTATAFRSHTKVEQYSNPSFVSVSQDTGLSTDMNTETSSVISKRDVGVSRSYNDPDYPPSSATPADDYISFWEY